MAQKVRYNHLAHAINQRVVKNATDEELRAQDALIHANMRDVEMHPKRYTKGMQSAIKHEADFYTQEMYKRGMKSAADHEFEDWAKEQEDKLRATTVPQEEEAPVEESVAFDPQMYLQLQLGALYYMSPEATLKSCTTKEECDEVIAMLKSFA